MATLTSIFVLESSATQTGSILNAASSAEITVGHGTKFVLSATGGYHIKFGAAGLTDAAAGDQFVPNGVVAEYDMGRSHESIKIFNDSGATISWWLTPLGN